METTQVQQLKLNVTNISSFLKQSNKTYIGLKKKNSDLLSNQVKEQKLQEKEKKIETKNITGFGLGKIGNKIASTGGSIFDKILGFGSFILAGILVNSLPAIFKKVMEFVDNIVNFVTPIYSGFRLLQAIITKEPLDNPELSPEKKRFTDELKKAKLEVDKIQKNLGIGGFILTPIQLFINEVIRQFGGNSIVLAKKGGKEGFLDTNTDTFFEKPFTSAERKKFQTGGRAPSTAAPDSGAAPAGGGGGSATYGTKEQKAMLSAISFAEGTDSYGTIYGGKVVPELAQGKLTIGQVLEMQRTGRLNGRNVGYARDGYDSDATGRYQFMSYVLKEEMQKQGFSPDTLFTPALQDQMILGRISSLRGVTAGMLAREGMSANVIDRLAPEFASFPNLMGDVRHGYGTSYYGQGGKSETAIRSAYNRALGSIISPAKITPNTKNKDKQVSSLNTTMGEEGSTTFILARQPILT